MSLPLAIVQRTGSSASGSPLDVAVLEHADRYLVFVNEGIGAFGSVISARWDRPSSARLDEADASASESRTCDIRVLLGDSEDPLAHVYASRILDGIAKCRPSDDKGMILSLALKRKPSDVEADVVGSPLWDANRSNLETVLGLLKDCGLL